MKTLVALIFSMILVGSFPFATQAAISAGSASDELRVALVIGNSDYPASPLASPVADARGMSGQLRRLGFHVISLENARAADMLLALREFGDTLNAVGGVGLFYYAGHGIQVDGENYLIPVDADVSRQRDIKYRSLSLNQVLNEMGEARNRVNMVILDACRDNPFGDPIQARAVRGRGLPGGLRDSGLRGGGLRGGGLRGGGLRGGGLAPLENAPSGTLIAFATAPGRVAVDGDDNGIFTKHLLKHLSTPGLAVEQMLKLVRRGVMAETRDFQVPWENSSLTGDFFFNPLPSESSSAATRNVDAIQPLTVSLDQLRLVPAD